MGVNIVQKRTGEKLVDLTGATLSSSDGGKILTGETAYGRDGNKITGTMSDNGSMTAGLSTKTATKTIPAGYTSGGTVSISTTEQNKIVSGNIKSGVSILGVNGTFTSDATATAADILGGDNPKTAYVNGNKITGTMPDYRDFDLYGIKVKVDRVIPGSDSDMLTIPACDLSNRPVQFILAFAAGPSALNNISTTSSSGSNIIVTVMYDRKQHITNSSGVAHQFYYANVRPRYYQSKAWMSWTIGQNSTTVTLESESGLAAGTAYLKTTAGYFKGGMAYLMMVGG